MDLPTLTISAGKGWLDQRKRFSNDISGKEKKYYTLLSKNELSYNKGNSKLAKYGVVFKLNNFDEALVPKVYHSFKTTSDVDPDFIEYIFSSKKPDRELSRLITSTARMDGLLNINYDDFMSIKITFPSRKEQLEIAYLLRSLDKIITLHQRKINIIKKLKKYFSTYLLTKKGEYYPKLRFGNFTSAWENYKLGELGSFVRSSINPQVTTNDEFVEYSMPAFDNKKLPFKVMGSTMQSSRLKISGNVLLINKLNVRKKRIWLVKDAPKNAVCSSEFMPYISRKINLEFLEQLMLSDKSTHDLQSFSSGTSNSQKRITPSDFLKYRITVPIDETEQNNIGALLSHFDKITALHQRGINDLNKLKKTYLNKIFL